MDEPAWQRAPGYGDFIQRTPFVGQPVTEPTEFRILYDDKNLYIGVRCFDSDPKKIIRRTVRFDSTRIFNDDFIEVKLDPSFDRKTAYVFSASARGTPVDYKTLNNDEQTLFDWDVLWDVATKIDEQGWVAEYRIPFTSLDFDPKPEAVMHFNVTRQVARKQERSDWSHIPPPFSGDTVSFFGTLRNISVPENHWRQLTLFPYVASGYEQDLVGTTTGDNPGDINPVIEPGFDLKYPLTRTVTLQGTLNTDFSEVDIDETQVNLNRFKLLFPEKRTFFLEGARFFDFGITGVSRIFFSRRIGIEENAIVPIIGGVRSFGTVGRSEFGVLNITTDREGDYPARNYSVARFRQRVLSNSEFGFIATQRQDIDSDSGNNTAFGLDSYWRTPNNQLVIEQWLAGTHSNPGPTDNDIKGIGTAGWVKAIWRTEHWRLVNSHLYLSDHFNPEIGFLSRQGIYRPEMYVSRYLRFPRENIKQIDIYTGGGIEFTNEANDLLNWWYVEQAKLETNQGYVLFVKGIQASDEVLEPFDLTDTVTIPAGRYRENSINCSMETPTKHNIQGALHYTYGGFFNGTKHQLVPSFVLRPFPQLYLSIASDLSWIEIPPIQADFLSADLNFSGSYSITPKIYLDANSSWNKTDEDLALQYRLRWRFRPLSDFFVIYSEQRESTTFRSQFRSLIFKVVVYFEV